MQADFKDPRLRACYHEGMLLTAEDLSVEKKHYEWRLREHSRRAGPGVVEGLGVSLVGDEADTLRVEPGLAIDAAGRALALCKAKDIPLVELKWPAQGDEAAYLCLVRQNTVIEHTTTLLPPDGAEGVQPVRIREGAKLQLLSHADLPWPGWRESGFPGDATPHASYPTAADSVPLAKLRRADGRLVDIDLGGGAPTWAASTLTAIVRTNWCHGGEHDLALGLSVAFSRPIRPAPAGAFRVTVERGDGTLSVLRAVDEELAPENGARELTWRIAPGQDQRLAGTVRVEILCDFVLDENDVPISGAHLGGRLPSGDGRPGGRFESWLVPVVQSASESAS